MIRTVRGMFHCVNTKLQFKIKQKWAQVVVVGAATLFTHNIIEASVLPCVAFVGFG